jgi:hypothetical protein
MAIIVSSKVQKDGSSLSGDIKQIVLVRTEAGYASDPGHAGWGKVIAVLGSVP